jgi:DNA invertase Pin-like site-specific DNA recombinase
MGLLGAAYSVSWCHLHHRGISRPRECGGTAPEGHGWVPSDSYRVVAAIAEQDERRIAAEETAALAIGQRRLTSAIWPGSRDPTGCPTAKIVDQPCTKIPPENRPPRSLKSRRFSHRARLYPATTELRTTGNEGTLNATKRIRRAALYLRVSTDRQTVENQELELRQVAERRGWEVVEVYHDAGISGAKGRKDRPGFDRLLNDASRRKFDVAMAWAIDRIGRSLLDLLTTIQHLEAVGVDLYLDRQNIDTTTPMGKLIFQVCGAFAEFERAMIQQRIHAGLSRAKKAGKVLGRPRMDPATKEAIRLAIKEGGRGVHKIAKELGVGVGTVQRVKADLAEAGGK